MLVTPFLKSVPVYSEVPPYKICSYAVVYDTSPYRTRREIITKDLVDQLVVIVVCLVICYYAYRERNRLIRVGLYEQQIQMLWNPRYLVPRYLLERYHIPYVLIGNPGIMARLRLAFLRPNIVYDWSLVLMMVSLELICFLIYFTLVYQLILLILWGLVVLEYIE